MTRSIRLSPAARGDITRLVDFLLERDERAAMRAHLVLERALVSLFEFPERGYAVDSQAGVRELKVEFGRYGYAIQYRVDPDAVFVSHIFHVREAR